MGQHNPPDLGKARAKQIASVKQTIANNLQHGDVLVCYGKGWIPLFISIWTGLWNPFKWGRNRFSSPSHIAFASEYYHTGSGASGEKSLLVFESTTLSKLKDWVSKARRSGVQAHAPYEWLHHYTGRVEVMRLRTPMTTAGKESSALYAMSAHRRQAEYDTNQAFGAGLRTILNTEDGTALFCSEFCAFFLQKGGVLTTAKNCSEQTPLDVARFKCLATEETLVSLHKASL